MFYFGNPEDTARLYVDHFTTKTGPVFPSGHLDEMSEQEIRFAMAYLYGATEQALREGAEPEVVEVLTGWHDEAFQALAEVSEKFRQAVRTGRVVPLGGPKNFAKYVKLAGLMD